MASMSLSMSPKLLLANNKSADIVEAPRLANMVTYVKYSSHARARLVATRATPEKLSESIEQSIETAKEECAENPVSGECAAAWDEVEEVSAAASHARDKNKANSDPLETYCKDNPETDECRTYDN